MIDLRPRPLMLAYACAALCVALSVYGVGVADASLLPPPPGANAPALDLSRIALPHSAHLVYLTSGSVRLAGMTVPVPVHGTTKTDWQLAGGRFQSSLVNELAEFSQTSRGHLRPSAGLAPERYTEKRHHRAEIATNFDWETRRMSFTQSPDVIDAPDGIQDRLSIQFQMALLREAYPNQFAPGSHFSINVAGTHDYAEWLVAVCCDEPVDTGRGLMPAVKVHSHRAQFADSKEGLDLWLSPGLGWFPVRVRLTDHDGNVIDSVLESATID